MHRKGSDLQAEPANDLLSLLPNTGNAAVLGDAADPRAPMSHQELQQLIQGLQLSRLGISPGVRVGIIISNGPELAVLLVALLSCCSVVPINAAGSLEEFTSEIVSTGVDLLITDDDDSQRLAALTVLAHQMPLPLLVMNKDSEKAGVFTLAHAYKIMTTYDEASGGWDGKLGPYVGKHANSRELVLNIGEHAV
ncbi:hypothetical protein COO60DRAFT_1668419 [Scenedesmus sp. NREL 46B-D3]|nr:hypothetical protein COO60DRAFT_1668419 [Scenedesmus sp. NREL 46B-D3]